MFGDETKPRPPTWSKIVGADLAGSLGRWEEQCIFGHLSLHRGSCGVIDSERRHVVVATLGRTDGASCTGVHAGHV